MRSTPRRSLEPHARRGGTKEVTSTRRIPSPPCAPAYNVRLTRWAEARGTQGEIQTAANCSNVQSDPARHQASDDQPSRLITSHSGLDVQKRRAHLSAHTRQPISLNQAQ